MALQREIWIKSVIENLFADNSFASQSLNHSEFVNGKTVHVPQAGAVPGVEKNRSSFPAKVKEREDSDLTYQIDEYTVNPLRISNADKVELSYNKRESIIYNARKQLENEIYTDLIYRWIPTKVESIVTSGKEIETHLEKTTGKRKALTKADIKAVKKLFDRQDIPQDDRYILLDADMYNQLENDLTAAETNNFLAGANPEKGVIGMYAGFKFYMRSKVARVDDSNAPKEWSKEAAATDKAAGLAWYKGSVSRALGASVMFNNEKDPTYYGDVLSFLQRAGGHYMFSGKQGIALLIQG